MRRAKKVNTYFGILIITIFIVNITACGAQDEEVIEDVRRPSETYSCPVQELSSYLHGYETDCPYISADIIINRYSVEPSDDDRKRNLYMTSGDAEVTWHFYDSLEQMENALATESGQEEKVLRSEMEDEMDAEEDNAASDTEIRLLYYVLPLPEDVHALDIYHTLEERYGTEEHPIWVLSYSDEGIGYYLMQGTNENGFVVSSEYYKSAVNLYIKDGLVYGLNTKNIPDVYTGSDLEILFMEYFHSFDGEDSASGWVLNEERLYWIDHEERVTSMEEPDRTFLEVRGIDENWESAGYEGIMTYFGMLKEADYEVPLTEDGPMLDIHLFTAAYPSEEEYRYYLWNGNCMDEKYHMIVSDKETGRELQRSKVILSVEITDTITFTDLNADGYVDMQIDKPVHWSGEQAAVEPWSARDYILWNPEKEGFERKTWEEVRSSLLANQNTMTGEYTEYIVQPGDCLWSISERFLGSGSYWPTLQREENAPEDPNYLLPGEIIVITAVEDTFDIFLFE